MTIAALPVAFLLLLPQAASRDAAAPDISGQLADLQGQVFFLRAQIQKRDELLDGLRKELRSMSDEVGGLRERVGPPVAAPFLAGPPASSDAVGVAKVAVFAPRIEVEAARRHDLIGLKVRRLDAAGSKLVGETELGSDADGVDLPLDQNGALYVVDWTTSEGFTINLVLRDGATGQPAANVQVKQFQREGRFLFVGYRID